MTISHPWSAVYASFTRRALARFIDFCVVLTPCALLYLINLGLGFPVRYTSLFNWVWPESATMFMSADFPGVFLTFVSIKLGIAFPYFALMDSSRWQGTLGKRAMGIKLTTIDGEQISFGRATGRFFSKSVSAILFMAGYLVSFSDKRQTWHDYLCRTLVLRQNFVPKLYVLPRVQSGWMFDGPGFARQDVTGNRHPSGYVCISCNYQSNEKRIGCPACRRPYGYVDVNVLKGLCLMNGVVFTLIGSFLTYVAYWVIWERVVDYQMQRDGTPVGIIFIILVATVSCVTFGISALFGARWPLRLLLTVSLGLARR